MPETTHRPTRPKLYVIKNPRRLPPPHLSTGDRVMLFDGECVLCRRMIQCLIRIDSRQRIRLATVQSPPGQALLRWAGLPVDDFNTIAYIAQGQVSVRSEAFLQALTQLGWPWRALAVMRVLPRELRDRLYDGVARHRYRWFGKLPAGTLPPDDKGGNRYLDHGQDCPKSGSSG